MTTPTLDVLTGLAGALVTGGVGVYRSDASEYQPGEIGIYLNNMPDQPDQAIVLTPYFAGSGDILLTIDRIAIQVRTRGSVDPRTEFALRDGVYAAFQGLRNLVYGSVHLIVLELVSSVPLGRDTAGRWEYSSNYYADIDMPVTALRS